MHSSTWKRIEFFVPGHPQPNPKDIRRGGGVGITKRDEDGRKEAWRQNVRVHAQIAMAGMEMLDLTQACRLGVEVRVFKPKSNKKPFPTQVPDWSNYRYYVENILKGCVYQDDCSVIGPLPGDKVWVFDRENEGVLIIVEVVE